MAQKLDLKDIVSVEEVLLASAIEQEALVNLLVKNGLINKEELLGEIRRLKKKYYK